MLRELIIFHKDNYKSSRNVKNRFFTKEFVILVFLVALFIGTVVASWVFTESPRSLFVSIFFLTVFGLLPVLYIDRLERYTTFFVNDDDKYRIQLKGFLSRKLDVTTAPQLELLIKSLVEERDQNIKRLGIPVSYIAICISLATLFLNKSNLDIRQVTLFFTMFFVVIYVVQGVLKIAELFFNSYPDKLSALIRNLKIIQLDWLKTKKNNSYKK